MKYLLCCTFTFINKVLILSQEFSLDLVISQQWTDPRLNNSLDHPIVLPGDSKNLIWLPDTFFLNIRSASIHDVMSENSKLSIKPGGVVSYSTRLVVVKIIREAMVDGRDTGLFIIRGLFPETVAMC